MSCNCGMCTNWKCQIKSDVVWVYDLYEVTEEEFMKIKHVSLATANSWYAEAMILQLRHGRKRI